MFAVERSRVRVYHCVLYFYCEAITAAPSGPYGMRSNDCCFAFPAAYDSAHVTSSRRMRSELVAGSTSPRALLEPPLRLHGPFVLVWATPFDANGIKI